MHFYYHFLIEELTISVSYLPNLQAGAIFEYNIELLEVLPPTQCTHIFSVGEEIELRLIALRLCLYHKHAERF